MTYFGELSSSEAAPDADLDGDGIKNLLEFAFNTNPLQADTTRRPGLKRSTESTAKNLWSARGLTPL